jgi:arylsulfatase A-like enzyme
MQAASAVALRPTKVALPAGRRPINFVVILADDLGYGDLGVFGSPTIRTPHINRMAAEGVRFTSFYATPVCTPSRAALMTGRYPIRSGLVRVIHPGEKFGIPASEITLPKLLRDRGYATACIGKWHLGGLPQYRPLRHGFDYYYGLLFSNDMTLRPPDIRRLRLFRNDEAIEWPVDQSTLTKRYTEEALAFISRNRRKPFFLYLAHTMPHVPLHASGEFRGKSLRGLYGDAAEEIDASTGRVFGALKDLGIDEDTMVIFTSDNGPALSKGTHGGSAGLLRGGKGTTWEGGVRVPFVARCPGRIPEGSVEHGIASLMDMLPSLAALSGSPLPSDRAIDGKDITAMLLGEANSPHTTHFYYSGTRIHAVRWEGWKLHLFLRESGVLGVGSVRPCDPPQLYNLNEDPGERFDLAEENPQLVSKLAAMAKHLEEGVKPGTLPPRFFGRSPH